MYSPEMRSTRGGKGSRVDKTCPRVPLLGRTIAPRRAWHEHGGYRSMGCACSRRRNRRSASGNGHSSRRHHLRAASSRRNKIFTRGRFLSRKPHLPGDDSLGPSNESLAPNGLQRSSIPEGVDFELAGYFVEAKFALKKPAVGRAA